MIEIKKYISKVIHAGLVRLEIKENVIVEKSANPDFGDFSSNIAMALAKKKSFGNCGVNTVRIEN